MQDKIYFPGLNGLRFFAAFSVIYYHLSVTDTFGEFRQHYFLSHFTLTGGDAVTLFFVLSGFLITYLLMAELKATDTIQVRKFYLRRILRIWPLYYFMVFLGFVIFPMLEHLTGNITAGSLTLMPTNVILTQFGLHLVMLPQVSFLYMHYQVNGIQQLWSIGIEECFYLMWPVLVLVFRKHVLALLLGFIAVKFSLHFAASFLSRWESIPDWFLEGVGFINAMHFENMAMGGLGAYILFTNRERLLRLIYHPVVEKGVLLILVANIFLFTEEHHSYSVRLAINYFLMVVYTLLILNISSNPRSTLKLEYPIFNKLGRISYGLYMYHLFVMYVISMLFSRSIFLTNDSPLLTLLLYLVVPLTTIVVAQLSYTYFEQPFLRLKTRFTVVKSGEPDAVADTAPATSDPVVLEGKVL